MSVYTVTIPHWEDRYKLSERTQPKYWLWKDSKSLPLKHQKELRPSPLIFNKQAFCCDNLGQRFLKNATKAGKPNEWILNGQELYNAKMHYTLRKKVAAYYHDYFSKFIVDQLAPIKMPPGVYLSVSCDIFLIERGNMPDVDNMWLLEKFFLDALHLTNRIPDDDKDTVREAGRKRYHMVKDPSKRKLVFTIKFLNDEKENNHVDSKYCNSCGNIFPTPFYN
tara:strand:- start:421 stop:1086 length:666 start_codon:yes stop_codon:yes gene_type:complete